MIDDDKIYDECVAELSPEAQADICELKKILEDKLTAKRMRQVVTSFAKKIPMGLGEKGLKELIIVLIKQGYL
jgi:hypothetical protein